MTLHTTGFFSGAHRGMMRRLKGKGLLDDRHHLTPLGLRELERYEARWKLNPKLFKWNIEKSV